MTHVWFDVYSESDLETPTGRIGVQGGDKAVDMAMFDLNRGRDYYCSAVKRPKLQTFTPDSGPMECERMERFYSLKLTAVRSFKGLKGVAVEQVDAPGDGVDVVGNLSDYILRF